MFPTFRLAALAGALSLLALSCSGRVGAIREPIPRWVSALGPRPLAVRDLQVSASEGVHVLLLKLSRFPDSISDRAQEKPPRIRLQLGGPDAGGDLPEQRIITQDALVRAVRIARKKGTVYVTLEIRGDNLPAYSVHEMADWLMVRLAPGR